jgi:hypothetical protein
VTWNLFSGLKGLTLLVGTPGPIGVDSDNPSTTWAPTAVCARVFRFSFAIQGKVPHKRGLGIIFYGSEEASLRTTSETKRWYTQVLAYILSINHWDHNLQFTIPW